MSKKIYVFLFVLLCFTLTLPAQFGVLDQSFGNGGIVIQNVSTQEDYPTALSLYPDGRIAVAGYYLGAVPGNNGFRWCVARFLANGSLDLSFANNGSKVFSVGQNYNDLATDVHVLPDNSMLICGGYAFSFSTNQRFMIVKLDSAGDFDTNFGMNGRVSLNVGTQNLATSIAVHPDGRIYVAGSSLNAQDESSVAVVRLMADGTVDASFGSSGVVKLGNAGDVSWAEKVLIQPDGKILMAGTIYENYANNGIPDIYVIRLDSTGALDATFGNMGLAVITPDTGVGDFATDLALYPNGQIMVGGQSTYTSHPYYSFMALRLNADGSVDSTYGTNGYGIVNVGGIGNGCNSLLLQPDGKVILGGVRADTSGGFNDVNTILRLDANGTLDPTWGTNGIVEHNMSGSSEGIEDMVFRPSGEVVATSHVTDTQVFEADFALEQYTTGITIVGALKPLETGMDLTVYPNPIVESTYLKYELEQSEYVSLELFDLQGRKVHSFFQNELKSAGAQVETLTFPASMKDGFYILRLSSPSGSKSVAGQFKVQVAR